MSESMITEHPGPNILLVAPAGVPAISGGVVRPSHLFEIRWDVPPLFKLGRTGTDFPLPGGGGELIRTLGLPQPEVYLGCQWLAFSHGFNETFTVRCHK
jgi:hypothetical protein